VNDEREILGWKQFWSVSRCYSNICLGGLMKTTETLVRIARLQSKFQNQDASNIKQVCYILQ